MATQIKLPNLGENIESGDVLTIFVSEGDTVKANQDLMEIETDKATMPVPAPQAGKITKILVGEGDTVEVGAAIMEIEASELLAESSSPPNPQRPKKRSQLRPKPKKPEPEEEEAKKKRTRTTTDSRKKKHPKPKAPPKKPRQHQPEPEEDEDGRRAGAKPVATKAKAKKASAPAEIDRRRPGRWPRLRRRRSRPFAALLVSSASIFAAFARPALVVASRWKMFAPTSAKPTSKSPPHSPSGVTPPGTANTDDFGGVRLEKMSRMRQTIARNMVESYTTIPQLTNFDDADVTELEDMREQSKADYADRGIKLTAMSFVIKAIASSLKRHPMLNASVDMETNTIMYKEYVNIGIAVDTERGLVVPVLRDADRKSISQIASEIEELAGTVREGKFDLDLIKGGTFTISNMGAVGGTYSTPIINPPQVAILLVGRTRIVPQIVRRRRRSATDDAAFDHV